MCKFHSTVKLAYIDALITVLSFVFYLDTPNTLEHGIVLYYKPQTEPFPLHS